MRKLYPYDINVGNKRWVIDLLSGLDLFQSLNEGLVQNVSPQIEFLELESAFNIKMEIPKAI